MSRTSNLPENRMRVLVPFLNVASLRRSLDFYQLLGFQPENTFVPPGATEPSWAFVKCWGAQLMLAKAQEPVVPSQQGALFYIYCDDVPDMRQRLVALGLEVGELQFPFYAPRGEFSLTDPDGYRWMVSHT